MRGERGFFITLEGIEGCGKTTQIGLLSQWLTSRHISHVTTKQPGGTLIGREIRKILLHKNSTGMTSTCEALLYLADRAQHHTEVIEPNLVRGNWVICDRYQDSTRAYQGAARGLDIRELDHIFSLITGNLQPDLTILLDLDPEQGLARAKQRLTREALDKAEGRFEDESLAFHAAVRRFFLNLAASEPDRFVVVDAGLEPGAIHGEIQRIVQQRQPHV